MSCRLWKRVTKTQRKRNEENNQREYMNSIFQQTTHNIMEYPGDDLSDNQLPADCPTPVAEVAQTVLQLSYVRPIGGDIIIFRIIE